MTARYGELNLFSRQGMEIEVDNIAEADLGHTCLFILEYQRK